MSDFNEWCTRSRVLRFIRETWEGTDEFDFHHGPSQADVAHEFFGSDFRQALSALNDLERLGHARRVVSFGLYRWIPNEVPRPAKRTAKRRQQTRHRSEVTERILAYVGAEFTEGKSGNRDSLPSTYDVAKACTVGNGSTKACRRTLRHLNRLVMDGEIIQVKDDDVSPNAWHYVFWAVKEPGGVPTATTVSGLATQLNRYGFTDEAWAAMKPYQRNLIRSIELADTEPSSWA